MLDNETLEVGGEVPRSVSLTNGSNLEISFEDRRWLIGDVFQEPAPLLS